MKINCTSRNPHETFGEEKIGKGDTWKEQGATSITKKINERKS